LPRIDVMHVHFGYESRSESELTDWVRLIRSQGCALVVTVHDLRNPHQSDPRPHARLLAILLAAADEVITLTTGAATEIRQRWGRTAVVIAHPSLLDQPGIATPADHGRPAVVGVHLKSLRANIVEPGALVEAARRGADRANAVLRVDLHPDVFGRAEVAGIRAAASRGLLDLRVHPRFDDAEVVDYLSEIAVSVLPYRFGTHSGWLELCRDVGVAVVSPDCGFYSEQWSGAFEYQNNEGTGLHAGSLNDAVARAVETGSRTPADAHDRARSRERIRAAHGSVYRRAVHGGRR
jgi:hypothetical protein